MNFRTEINLPPPGELRIGYPEAVFLTGSCFAENISVKFREAGFRIDVNPFGILYNPASISQSIRQLMEEKTFTAEDLFQEQGIYHSFSHHSRFSGGDPERMLAEINLRVKTSGAFLRESKVWIITFGTAYAYRLKSTGDTVANCHKLPDRHFTRKRLEIAGIVSDFEDLIREVRSFNPSVKIVFTVSPIRHWKEGAHENQLSKSILLLATDQLVKNHPDCFYFPSYELLLDDLRDYRFYAADMLHPSAQAVGYIWEKFSAHCFDEETRGCIREWIDIRKALDHKPLNPDSDTHKAFRERAEEREKIFLKKHSRR